jgi:hypothetical protein
VRTAASLALTAGLVLLPAPHLAQAASLAGLTISVPASASLGTVSTGASQVSGSLGNVTVSTGISTGSGGWVATVSATSFKTGGGTNNETIANSAVSYASGAVTAVTGLAANLCTPQLLNQSLSTSRTAMSCSGFSLLSATSVTWRPTITISLSPSAVAGSYTGTITHSVA